LSISGLCKPQPCQELVSVIDNANLTRFLRCNALLRRIRGNIQRVFVPRLAHVLPERGSSMVDLGRSLAATPVKGRLLKVSCVLS